MVSEDADQWDGSSMLSGEPHGCARSILMDSDQTSRPDSPEGLAEFNEQ